MSRPSLAPSRLLLPDDAPFEPCPAPVEKKYHHPGIWCCGLMPPFEQTPTEPIVMSREYFGSGGEAFRLAFVSSELYHAVDAAKIKGFDFHPVTNS